jgi:heparosan-N-sulfate-glucuronate 5-epimerase
MNLVRLIQRILQNIKKYFEKTYYFKIIENIKINDFPYLIDFEYWINTGHYNCKDINGVPYNNYRKFGKQYNWTRICSYTLYHYNRYVRKNDKNDFEIFMKMINFLYKKADIIKDTALWRYEMPWNGMKKGWISGMAQGEIISVFARAYYLTKEKKYLEIAKMAYNAMIQPLDKGGTLNYFDDNKSIVFEEYPNNNPSHVLNGNIISLIGIYDIYFVTKDKQILKMFDDSINSLLKYINIYIVENNRWTVYDNSQDGLNYVTPVYQSLHIALMDVLSFLTDKKKFADISEKWKKSYLSFSLRLKALVKKIIYRLKVKSDM